MKKLAAAATAITLLLVTPALAQRPLSANQLPNSGVVDYEGTFSGQDFTAPISITVDFAARTVSADLTIPELNPQNSGAISPPQHYTPTGSIDSDGGLIATGGPAGVGVFGFGNIIGAQSVIVLAGNFFTGRAKTAAGEFIAQFVFEGGVIRTRSGEFSATRVQ
jgi:hypothetical protein